MFFISGFGGFNFAVEIHPPDVVPRYVSEALSYWCVRPEATSVRGFKLLVYAPDVVPVNAGF